MKDIQKMKELTKPSAPFMCSVRFVMSLFLFVGFTMLFIQRTDISIGIICMTNNTALRIHAFNATQKSTTFPTTIPTTTTVPSVEWTTAPLDENEKGDQYHTQDAIRTAEDDSGALSCGLANTDRSLPDGPFLYTKNMQAHTLSIFMYGYILTQIPGGFIAYHIGGVRTITISILIGSLMTLLVPFAARQSFYLLLACRFFNGLAHGPFFPAIGIILSKWSSASEKSRLYGISSSGIQVGNICGLMFSGFLCVEGFDSGWPSIFYIYGCIGIVWSFVFLSTFSESPRDQKLMSDAERDFIVSNTAQHTQKQRRIPWKRILTSPVLFVLMVTMFCFNSGLVLFLSLMPIYMSEVLKFDIKWNGYLSAFTFFISWIVILASSFLSDYLIERQTLSKLNVRKLFTCIGILIPAISLMLISFVTCDNRNLAVLLLCVANAFSGFCSSGFFVNTYEIGGAFSSIIVAMASTFGNLPGIILPVVAGALTPNKSPDEWKLVFWLVAISLLIGALIYTAFADVRVQPWAIHVSAEGDDDSTDVNDVPSGTQSISNLKSLASGVAFLYYF